MPEGTGDGNGAKGSLNQQQLDEINKILTSRDERTARKLEEMFKARDAAKAKAKEERAVVKAKAKEEKKAAKAAEKAAGGGAVDGKAKSKDDAEARFDARVKALEKQLAEEKKRSSEVEAKRLADEQWATAAQQLTDAGVKNVKGALALLKSEERVGRSKDGKIVFRMPKDGYVDEQSIDEGVKAWVATDEGKFYLPPIGASGSGAGGGGPPSNGRSLSKDDRKAAAYETLGNLLTQRPTV